MKKVIFSTLLLVSASLSSQAQADSVLNCEVQLKSISTGKIITTSAVMTDQTGIDDDFEDATASILELAPTKELKLPVLETSIYVQEDITTARNTAVDQVLYTESVEENDEIVIYTLALSSLNTQVDAKDFTYAATLKRQADGKPVLLANGTLTCK